jgi:hypothetical protein
MTINTSVNSYSVASFIVRHISCLTGNLDVEKRVEIFDILCDTADRKSAIRPRT